MNILFNGHDFKFLTHVIDHFKSNPYYEIFFDDHPGHVVVDKQKSLKLLDKADIIFCEWCLGNAEWYSHHKKENQLLLIRLHHQEIGLAFLDNILWDKVDKIIFICQNNLRLFLEKFPHLKSKTILIYNVIDCNAFDVQKLPGAEFNLGFIGSSPMRKAPHIALEIFFRLKKIDKRYCLFFKGKHPWEYPWLWRRPEEREYFEKLYDSINNGPYSNSIVFDPHGNDIPEWFSKIGFLLSTSDHEGSHQAVAEGMASGAIPVIRNWDGADLLYPPKYVFKSVDEAISLIQTWKTPNHYLNESSFSKEFANLNFDKKVIITAYENLINSLL